MPTIVQTVNGTVTGLWGSALYRTPSGKLVALKMGHVVLKGDLILTAQDGIVQLTPAEVQHDAVAAHAAAAAHAAVAAPAEPADIDRVIAQLNEPSPDTAPAAGLTAGDGSGLQPGLRVDRIAEDISPTAQAQVSETVTQTPAPAFTVPPDNEVGQATPATPNARPTADAAAASGAEEATLAIPLTGQDSDGTIAGVRITTIPPGSTVLLADGITPVTVGQVLTPAEAASLLFRPAPDFNGGTAVGFVVIDDLGSASAPQTIQITVLPVNDTPVASPETVITLEDTPVSGNVLANETDVDGDPLILTGFTVGGNTYAAGSTAALAGVGTLVMGANGSFTFTPAPDYHGSVPLATYTVGDGTASVASLLTISVTPVGDTPVANDDGVSTPINTPITIDVLANDSDVDGDTLTVSAPTLSDPSQGTVTLDGSGRVVFTPAANVAGPVTITYTVTDASGASDTATLTVNVGANTPPTGANASRSIAEDGRYELVTNDFGFADADAGQSFAGVRIDTLPVAGTLLLDGAAVAAGTVVSAAGIAGGRLAYVPATDANGAPYGSFTFSVQDSSGAFDATPNTFTLDVAPVNDAPVTGADVVAATEDTPVTFDPRANDTDVDGPTLAITQVAGQPIAVGSPVTLPQGTVSMNPGGTLTFTPAPDFNGPVNFTYTVSDGTATADSNVTVNVAALNDAPVAADNSATTAEDTPVSGNVLANGSDIDAGTTLSVTQFVVGGTSYAAGSTATLASVGSLVIHGNGSYTFTPAPDFNGAVPVATYTVSDGSGAPDGTTTATLTLDVSPVNDAPVANDDVAATAINMPVTIPVLANDADVDGAPLTVGNPVLANPALGSVSVDADNRLVFTPASNVTGPVAITYTVTDLAGSSDTATVMVNVGSNTPPTGADATGTVAEDGSYSLATAGFADADAGQTFAGLRIDSTPTAGTLQLNGGAVTAGQFVSAADIAAGALRYVPVADANGAPYGSFTFSVQDSAGAFDTTPNTFTLNVTPVDDAPVVHPDTVVAAEDTPVTFDPRANDTDIDSATLLVTHVGGQPIAVGTPVVLPQGAVSMNVDGTLTFTPAPDFNGPVNFGYTVTDGTTPVSSTVLINVAPAPDAPVITGPLSGSVTEDTTLTSTGTLGIADPDAGESGFVPQAGAASTYGSFSITSTGAWTYTLNNAAANVQALAGGTSLDESFTVTTADGSTRSVVITVNGTSDVPVAINDTGTATEDTPLAGSVLANDSDVDAGTTLSVTQFAVGGTTYAAGSPASLAGIGSLVIHADGSYAFTPAPDYNGAVPDATYTVSDGTATSTATLTLTVTAVNDTPVGVNDSASLDEDTPASGQVLANDTDADGNTLSVTQFAVNGNTYAAGLVASLPQGALGMAANGAWTFTPAANYNGPVPVATYTVSDGTATGTATLTLNVTPLNDVPVGNDDVASTAINTPVTIAVLANDTDIDGGTLTVSNPVLADPSQGTVGIGTGGTLVFTPATNFSGPTTITYTVTDPGGLSDTATVIVNVGTNTPPTGADAARTLDEDTSYTVQIGDFGFADADTGQTLANVRIEVPPATGSLLLNGVAMTAGQVASATEIAAGHLVFVPAANANGSHQASLQFSVQDSAGAYDTAPNTLRFDLTPVPDAAVITPGSGSVSEDAGVDGGGNLTTGGTLTVVDPDAGEAAFQPQAATAGVYGNFALAADGTWAYTAANSNPAIQALSATQTLTETFTVSSVDGTTGTVTVTIHGTNDMAVITADTRAVTEDQNVNGAGDLTTGGSLNITDADNGEAVFQPQAATAGAYGSFALAADGTWTYTAANNNPAIQALGATQTLTETFAVASADGTPSSVTVTILGTNDVAVIGGQAAGFVTEAGGVNNGTAGTPTASGTLTVTDVDTGEAGFQAPASLNGTYGSFAFNANTGAWTYALDNTRTATQALTAGQVVHDTLTIASTDGSATQVIDVTVNGSNDNASISGTATGSIIEAGGINNTTASTPTASGTLTVTDVDAGQAGFQAPSAASLNGTYGNFTFNTSTGAWTYTLDNTRPATQALTAGQTVHDTLTVQSTDGTASRVVDVTVAGSNDNAAISGTATGAVTEAGGVNNVIAGTPTASGTLTVSDVDAGQAGFQTPSAARLNGTYGSFAFDTTTGAWTYTLDNTRTATQALTAGQTVHDTLTITSADGTATQLVDVTVTGVNDTATIGGTTTGAVTEAGGVNNGTGGTPTANGSLTVTDVDAGQASFQAPASLNGTYGSFTFNASTGAWTYALDNTRPATQALDAGQTVHDTLTVTSADGSATQVIDVTVNGSNDNASIGGTATGTVTEAGGTNNATAGMPAVSGTLTVTDVDTGQAGFQTPSAISLNGTYGSFAFNASTGAWTYTLDDTRAATQALTAGQTVHDTLTVTSADGSAARLIDVTLIGANDAAVIAGTAIGSVTEAGGLNNATAGTPTANGTLTVTDVDAGEAGFQAPSAASLNGIYGSFTFSTATGAWTYTLDNTRTATQALTAGQTVHDTLTITSADGTATQVVDVTVNGSNDNASIGGTATGSVTEAGGINNTTTGTPTASGTLTVSDVDAGQVGFQAPSAASLNGTYGSFAFDASTGAWTYTLDNTRSATQALTAGQTVHDTLTVTSTDGTASQLIDVTVTGTNDTAAIGGTTTGNVTEAGGVNNATASTSTASGTMTVTDVDAGQASFQTPASLVGTYGSFTFSTTTGAWTYALDNTRPATQALAAGQVAHDTLTIASTDGSATQVIDVTVNGSNDNASIGGTATGSVTEAGGINNATASTPTATGTLAVTDVDTGQAGFQAPSPASLNGTYGSFAFNTSTGAWTYTLDNTRSASQALTAGRTVHDTLTVQSTDGTASRVVDVTVTGSNDTAVIGGSATGTVTEAGGVNNATAGSPTANGTLTVTDVDTGQVGFQAPSATSLNGTYGSFAFNANTGAWTYTLDNTRTATQALTAGQVVHDTLTIASTDDSATQVIDVTVNGSNDTAVIGGTTTATVTEAGGVNNATAGSPTANGTLTVTDVDTGQASFETPASLTGTYGSFTFNTATGAWTYTLDNTRTATQTLTVGQVVHDTLTIASADGTATQVIDVTVNGSNDNASIGGTATGSVTEAGGINNATAGTPTANGTLTVTDVDTGQAGFQTPSATSLNGTYGSFAFNASTGAWTYTLDNTRTATQALTAGQTVHDTLTVQSTDSSATQVIDVTVTGTNDTAVIGGTTTGTVTEAGGLNNAVAGTSIASGTLAVTDVDAGEAGFQAPSAASLNGTFGSFTFDTATGAWTYTLDNTRTTTQALTAGQTVHDTLTINSTDGTASQVIDVTVNGSNDNASIGGTTTGSVTEAGGLNNAVAGTPTSSGTVTITDVDTGQASFQTPVSLNGTYGSFTFNGNTGAWTYTLDNTRPATQALAAGQTVHDTLSVTSADGTASRIIDVTVNGSNDNASIGGTATATVTEAGGLNNATAGIPTASGSLIVTDVDTSQAGFQAPSATSLNGTYGSFAFDTATGAWTYTLDNTRPATQALTAGQTVHDTLTVQSTDGTATQLIDVTVNGANDTANIGGTATGTVTEAGGVTNATAGTPTASGSLTLTDVDAGQASFQTPVSLTGTYGSFTFDTATGAWAYTLDNTRPATQALTAGQTVHDTLTVTSADGTATRIIDVTVNGSNDNASIGGSATGTVTEAGGVNNDAAGTSTASGTLTVADVDTGQASFQTPVSLTGTYGSFAFNANTGAWTYTLDNTRTATQALTAGQVVHDTLTVTSADGTASRLIDVVINGSNDTASISGSAVGNVTEAGGISDGTVGSPNASGTLSVTDIDAGEAFFAAPAPASLNGTYGTFTFNATNGAWTYVLADARAATQALNAGETALDTLTVTSADGTATRIIFIVVNGSNDNASIGGTATGSVTEAGGLGNAAAGTPTTGGTLTVADIDANQAGFQTPSATSLNGTYGSFAFNTATGAWTYTLDNTRSATQALTAGQTVHDTLTIASTDGSATQVIDVTVNGSNDTASIGGTATGALTEAGGVNNATTGTPTASGTLTVTDVDASQASFQTPGAASLNGTYGSFAFDANTGAWTYTLDNTRPATQALTAGQTVHDTLAVTSTDGTASRLIDVTVNGSNDTASIGGTATGTVTEAGGINNTTAGTPTASGTLTVTDVDSGEAGFQAPASLNGTYGSFTFNANTGAWTYALDNTRTATQALTAGQVVHDTLTITSTDASATQVIDVTVNGSNDNASIGGTATGSVIEAGGINNATVGTPTASGTLTFTDVDTGQAGFQTPSATSLNGTYGSFAFNASTGAWTYTLDNTRPATQALTAGQTVHDTLAVTSTDGTASQVVDVTVNGSNDNASIGGTATGTVTETGGTNNATAGTPTASGTLTVTDVDTGQAGFQTPVSLAGTYGSFAFNASTGAWTYTLDNTRSATQALTAGQTVHDTLTVTSTDGTASRLIDVTVTGSNDTASIGGTATGSVTEAGGVNNATAGSPTANGSLTVTDVDTGQASFQTPVSLNGTYGNFTFNASTGAWTYTLDNTRTATQALAAGQAAHDTLTIASTDGSATQVIDVTVNGSNDNASIGGTATGSVTEAGGINNATASTPTATGTLTVTDVDAGQAGFQTPSAASLNGTYGSFAFNASTGAWTYTLDNTRSATQALTAGQTVHDTLTVQSTDGTASRVVDVTVTGSNDTAVIGGSATGTVTEAGGVNNATAGSPTANGTLTVTDVDTGQASFQTPVSLNGTYGSFAFNASTGAWTYTLDNTRTATQALTAGQVVHDTLTIASTDGSATQVIDVTVNGSNDTANIGGTATGSVTEAGGINNATAGTPTANGTLTVTDVDASQAGFQAPNAASLNGTYGSFTFNTATGAWTYTLDNTRAATQALTAGQTVHDTLTVQSTDGTASRVVDMTVTGSNDNAAISGTDTGTVTEAGGVNNATAGTPTATGTLAIADADTGQASFQTPSAASLNGTYGSFAFDTAIGAWTYTLDNTRAATQSLTAGQTVHDTLTVTSADSTATRIIDVTVNGSNDTASIGGTATGAITEAGGINNATAGTPTANGTLTVTDVDTGQAGFQAPATASLNGTYGSFTFNTATGAWTYTLDNTRTATQALTAGQVAHDTLTIASTDGSASQVIDVTLNGSNDNATITGTATGAVTEAGGLNNATAGTPTATGTLAVADADTGQAGFQTPNAASLNGTYGSFAFNASTGAWTYALDNTRTATQALTAGQVAHDTLTVASADGTATQVIDVTVNGSNDTAMIGGTATGALTEAGGVNNATAGTPTASGTLTVTDVDAGQSGFQTPSAASLNGAYGSFAFNTSTGAWTYTLDNTRTATQALTAGQTVHDTLTVQSTDGSASRIIDVTVTGTNDNAVIGGTATGSVTEDVSVNGSGNIATGGTLTVTDVDTGQASFQAGTTIGTHGSFALAANGTWTYTASNSSAAIQALGTGQTLTETFTARSADGTASTVTVTINGTNDAPAATGSAVSGTEDTPLVFNWSNFGVTDVDTPSSSLGIRVSTLPSDGTLQVHNGSAWINVTTGSVVSKATIDAGAFRFVPDTNESGSDAHGGSGVGNTQADYARFNFTPNDGSANGAAATMRIDITPAADTPTLSHNASAPVSGTLSPIASIGLSRDFYENLATLASGPSSTNPDTGEIGIETAVPTSSAHITNVGVAGNVTDASGVQVADDDAYRVQGLIYLNAGRTYTFSGYADDTVRLEVGGDTLVSGQWGVAGHAQSGTFTSNTFAPTVTGYYSLEFRVYNTSGPGSYDLNVSVNGATAVDLSTANFLLFQNITQVDAAGAQRSAFVPNTTTGEGGYYPVAYDAGVQNKVYLAPVLAGLTDTDGSESLAVRLQGIPVGAVLTDGTNTFTATAAVTSVNITLWDRSQLAITFPSGYAGSTTLTAVATSTETATGATATTSTSFAVTVDPAGAATSQAEISTFNADALIGQAGNDSYTASEDGTDLTVAVTQGATGSIPAQTGTETTGTIHQAFSTGAGNDYVQSGAGNDTIHLGDTGASVHPVTTVAPTLANVQAARMMNLADDATLIDPSTGQFTADADDTSSANGSTARTSITTWADVANAGSGNDVVRGQNGTDFLYGGTGNDQLNGGAGNDGVRGGAGNDTLVGGAGNDALRGDAGADVFKWEFADGGTAGASATDVIMDFNTATPANGGDVLDLRDLLQGEATSGGAAGNLANYLHFTVDSGTTTIQISSTGGFSSGYSSGAVDQAIELRNVDLTSGGTLNTDQQIIQDLLSKSKLLVDGT